MQHLSREQGRKKYPQKRLNPIHKDVKNIFRNNISIKIIILRSVVNTFIIVSEPKPVTSGKINTKIPHKTPGMRSIHKWDFTHR